MKQVIRGFILGSLLVGGLGLAGCSSSPSDEELNQLAKLKDQVAALKTQVNDKEKGIAALQKQLADKNAKLQQCQADQEAVKKAMGK